MIILLFRLECRITQIAPEDGNKSKFMRMGERLGNLLDLAGGFGRSKINRRTHCSSSHIPGLFYVRKQNLIELVRISQKFVVIDFYDKRNFVREFSRGRSKNPQRRSDGVASAFNCELDDAFRIEINRIRRK